MGHPTTGKDEQVNAQGEPDVLSSSTDPDAHVTNQAVIDGLADTPTTVPTTASRDTAGSRLAMFTTAFLAAFVIWLPLQTPIDVFLYQYAGASVDLARAVLLLKDFAVALALVVLLVSAGRAMRLRWFDVAALGYLVVVCVYSVLPIALGPICR